MIKARTVSISASERKAPDQAFEEFRMPGEASDHRSPKRRMSGETHQRTGGERILAKAAGEVSLVTEERLARGSLRDRPRQQLPQRGGAGKGQRQTLAGDRIHIAGCIADQHKAVQGAGAAFLRQGAGPAGLGIRFGAFQTFLKGRKMRAQQGHRCTLVQSVDVPEKSNSHSPRTGGGDVGFRYLTEMNLDASAPRRHPVVLSKPESTRSLTVAFQSFGAAKRRKKPVRGDQYLRFDLRIRRFDQDACGSPPVPENWRLV